MNANITKCPKYIAIYTGYTDRIDYEELDEALEHQYDVKIISQSDATRKILESGGISQHCIDESVLFELEDEAESFGYIFSLINILRDLDYCGMLKIETIIGIQFIASEFGEQCVIVSLDTESG